MARQTIAAAVATGGYATAGVAAAETAADATNFEQTVHTGRNFLLIGRNSGVTTRAITITSVADQQGRTGDVSDTLTSGQRKVYGPFPEEGWKQTNGYLYFQAAHAEVLWSVIRF